MILSLAMLLGTGALPISAVTRSSMDRSSIVDGENDGFELPVELPFELPIEVSDGPTITDLYAQNEQISIDRRKEIILNFFNSQVSYDETFMDILAKMVDHVLDGTGDDFSDERLTNAVIEHPNTQTYTNAVADLVNDLIVASRGDISKLYYDEDLWIHPTERAQQIVVAAMKKILVSGDESLY